MELGEDGGGPKCDHLFRFLAPAALGWIIGWYGTDWFTRCYPESSSHPKLVHQLVRLDLRPPLIQLARDAISHSDHDECQECEQGGVGNGLICPVSQSASARRHDRGVP